MTAPMKFRWRRCRRDPEGRAAIEKCGFVFSVDGARPIAGFCEPKGAARRALPGDMAAWTFHDLRRSFAWLRPAHVPIHVVEKLLNHRSGSFGGIVGVYQRHEYRDEQRAAVELWARHIEQLLNGPVDNVVSLRGRPT